MWAMIAVLMVLLLLTVPIAFCIAMAAIAGCVLFFPGTNMIPVLAQSMATAVDNFPLLAIPYFTVMGSIMIRGGIADALVGLAKMAVGGRTGGLGMAAVIASMFFAAISGSGPATVAAIGGIMIPYMIAQKYKPGYSAALLGCASTIGPVIPPSIPMIMFGVTVGCSVSTLFLAGMIPGILMGVFLIVQNFFVAKKEGYGGIERKLSPSETKEAWKKGIWALFMPVIVLGTIYAGVCTPTESAVIGVAYSLIVGKFVFRKLSWENLKKSLVESGITTGTILVLMGGATTLARLLTLGGVPNLILENILAMKLSPILVMVIVNAVLLISGMFLDAISGIIIWAPLFVPILVAMGYDIIHVGVIFAINVSIGLVTPPLGADLYIGQKVAKCELQECLRPAINMLIILLLLLAILIIFPDITMLLPRLLGR
jgi:C4-dicarboxylate transporter DctM subunit